MMGMMANNSDAVNNLLNRLAYADLQEDYAPGDNLITVLRNSGNDDLADELDAAGYGNYVIRDYENQNDSNGFAAIAIEDPETGDVGISFRGTENLDNMGTAISSVFSGDIEAVEGAIRNQIDMIDNGFSAVTGDSPQVREAQDFFRRNQSHTGNNYLYGHSKGGNLALSVYVENYNNVAQVHTINAQPINWFSLTPAQRDALNNGRLDAVVIDGDLVWMLGTVPYPVRIIENNGTLDGSFFGPHLLSSGSYNETTGRANSVSMPYLNYGGQGILGGGLFCLITMAQAGYAYTRTQLEWIESAHRFFTEDVPEAARQAWESVNAAWEETKEFIGDTVENVGNFFSGVSEAVGSWWSEHFGEDERESNRHGRGGGGGGGGGGRGFGGPCQFQVDTRQLRDAAIRFSNVANSLEALESTLGTYSHSMQRITFIGTAALRGSLLAVKLKTGRLSSDVEKLANVLTEIAGIYDEAENQICGNTQY